MKVTLLLPCDFFFWRFYTPLSFTFAQEPWFVEKNSQQIWSFPEALFGYFFKSFDLLVFFIFWWLCAPSLQCWTICSLIYWAGTYGASFVLRKGLLCASGIFYVQMAQLKWVVQENSAGAKTWSGLCADGLCEKSPSKWAALLVVWAE